MRVQLPGQRHFKCHALPPITFVSLTHCLLLAAHYGLKNVKHVDSTALAASTALCLGQTGSHFKQVVSPGSAEQQQQQRQPLDSLR